MVLKWTFIDSDNEHSSTNIDNVTINFLPKESVNRILFGIRSITVYLII